MLLPRLHPHLHKLDSLHNQNSFNAKTFARINSQPINFNPIMTATIFFIMYLSLYLFYHTLFHVLFSHQKELSISIFCIEKPPKFHHLLASCFINHHSSIYISSHAFQQNPSAAQHHNTNS